MSSPIDQKEMKILLLNSGGRCAFPGCPKFLVQEGSDGDEPSIIGEMAHIVAEKREGPRGKHDLTDEERNRHTNLILLCRDHHKIVDDQPLTYSIPVLREMKTKHEAQVRATPADVTASIDTLHEETVYSTFLPVKSLPAVVFKGQCDFAQGEDDRVRELVNYPKRRSELAPFVFQPGWLYTFHDLRSLTNPFVQIVDPTGTIQEFDSEKMWKDPGQSRIYVSLMNSALRRYLGSLHVRYDREHKRFYFPAREKGQERSVEYKSLTGRKVSRKVVWQPIRRSTGEPKDFWWHLAAGLAFHKLGEKEWCVSIRPERHLTVDGEASLPPELIGRRVTRLKARMFNDKYFSEVNFWREFLAQGKPRVTLSFRNQSAMVDINPVQVEMKWPGVPDDEILVALSTPEDDLFSSAELAKSLGGDDMDDEDFEEDDEE
jgi:hypothetical protein